MPLECVDLVDGCALGELFTPSTEQCSPIECCRVTGQAVWPEERALRRVDGGGSDVCRDDATGDVVEKREVKSSRCRFGAPPFTQCRQVCRIGFRVARFERGDPCSFRSMLSRDGKFGFDFTASCREHSQHARRYTNDLTGAFADRAPSDTQFLGEYRTEVGFVEIPGSLGLAEDHLAVQSTPLPIRARCHIRDEDVSVELRVTRT